MNCASALVIITVASLGQPNGPTTADYYTSVSCNKQGTVFNSAWIHNFSTSPQVYLNGSAVPTYTVGGTTYGGTPAISASGPVCVVDTDDTSDPGPNNAVVWVAQNNYVVSKPIVAFCSVNGNNPFPVGYNSGTNTWSQAQNVWVAVTRQLVSHGCSSCMAVAVAWNIDSGPIYAQVFLVDPSTGALATSAGPVVQMSTGTNPGTLALGGISGDDYGNFVVSYVRQGAEEGSNGKGVYVSGFNYSDLLTGSTLGFAEFYVTSASEFNYSRVACYHGSSSTSGGFVVAWNNTQVSPDAGVGVSRYTTNWTSSPTQQASIVVGNGTPGYGFPGTSDYWQFNIACVRDTPGNYAVTWTTSYTSGGCGDSGVNNVVYAPVSSDAVGTIQMITDYDDTISDSPPYLGTLSSVALSDSTYSKNQIDYILTNNTPGCGYGVGTFEYTSSTFP